MRLQNHLNGLMTLVEHISAYPHQRWRLTNIHAGSQVSQGNLCHSPRCSRSWDWRRCAATETRIPPTKPSIMASSVRKLKDPNLCSSTCWVAQLRALSSRIAIRLRAFHRRLGYRKDSRNGIESIFVVRIAEEIAVC